MEALIRNWNGENVVVRFDAETEAWFFIAIHSTRLGPATGGTRMKSYPSPRAALQDALRLSEAMTLKYAVADFPRGGGKCVIALPGDFDPVKREALLLRYGAQVKMLGGTFETGPDVGTSPADMDIIARTGEPHVFCRTAAGGGAGDSAPATALGLFYGIGAVCERLFDRSSVDGRRILVQGVGSVGRRLIDLLVDGGAEVLISEIDPGAIQLLHDKRHLAVVPPESVYTTECDIFAPCALGGVLTSETIPRLNCRAVAGAANNQLGEWADAKLLRERGILYAPDYVVSLGGAMAITGIEAMGWSREEADLRLKQIGDTLRRVFDLAESDNIDTESAARKIAMANLDRPKTSR